MRCVAGGCDVVGILTIRLNFAAICGACEIYNPFLNKLVPPTCSGRNVVVVRVNSC